MTDQDPRNLLSQQYGRPRYSHTSVWRDGPDSTRSITCYSDNSQAEAFQKAEMEAAVRRSQRSPEAHGGLFGIFGL